VAGVRNDKQDAAGGGVRFPHLVAQERAADVLRRALRSGRLPHAYLFLGPEGAGKEAAAIGLARALLCDKYRDADAGGEAVLPCEECPGCAQSRRLTHPNLRILFPLPKPKEGGGEEIREEYSTAQQKRIDEVLAAKEQDPYTPLSVPGGQEILVEHIRALRREFRLTSFSGEWRVVLISQADRLRLQAANAFLKLLEEPPKGVLFLLTSSRESRLLPTIVSRCQTLRFPALSTERIAEELQARLDADRGTAELAARLARGSWRAATEWVRADPAAEIERAVEVLRILVKGDPGEMDVEVDRLASGPGEAFARLLVVLADWLRDVMRYEADPERYAHLGRSQVLVKFARHCAGRPFEQAIEAVDDARLDLERRVQPALVAHQLFFHLRRLLFAPMPAVG